MGSLDLPGLGISGLGDVLTDMCRITDVCDLPPLVDVNTGFGSSASSVASTVESMIKLSTTVVHIEDQVGTRRCGRRPNKGIVSQQGMVDRIRVTADARNSSPLMIMARTDAPAVEDLQTTIDRACACVRVGAGMTFPGAMTELAIYKGFAAVVEAPVLTNITEFGTTPLFATDELTPADVSLILYPLSAFRAMNKAAESVYTATRRDGTQKNVIGIIQTRMELYDRTDHHNFEQKLNAPFAQKKNA